MMNNTHFNLILSLENSTLCRYVILALALARAPFETSYVLLTKLIASIMSFDLHTFAGVFEVAKSKIQILGVFFLPLLFNTT